MPVRQKSLVSAKPDCELFYCGDVIGIFYGSCDKKINSNMGTTKVLNAPITLTKVVSPKHFFF